MAYKYVIIYCYFISCITSKRKKNIHIGFPSLLLATVSRFEFASRVDRRFFFLFICFFFRDFTCASSSLPHAHGFKATCLCRRRPLFNVNLCVHNICIYVYARAEKVLLVCIWRTLLSLVRLTYSRRGYDVCWRHILSTYTSRVHTSTPLMILRTYTHHIRWYISRVFR